MKSPLKGQRRAVAILGTLATGVALVLTSPQSSVAESSSASVTAARAAVTSSGFYATGTTRTSSGKKLRVSLSAYKADTASFNISLSTAGETHSWSFRAPKSAVKINAKGAGTIKLTSKQTGGLGKIQLKLKPTGKFKAYKCAGNVHSRTRNLKVSGPFFFDTRTKPWGKVGKKSGNFSFNGSRRASFSYDVDCPGPEFKDPCITQLSWSAYTSTPTSYLSIGGNKSGNRTTIQGSRSVTLKKPAGAFRHDSVTKKAKAPVLTVGEDDNAKLKIHGTSGSATATSSFPSTPYTNECDTGTQHQVNWSGSLANGRPALTVKAQVFGNFRIGNSASTYFGRSWRTA
ncbi:hypothetical protein ASG90_08065 [Nocardioides sp. Soil797]|nr:hypothetical protein ASG90_08065 [Nocardioides sp. Soil797]